jgi:hypothetical protein
VAEQKTKREGGGRERRPKRVASTAQFAKRAKRELADITGLEAEAVTSVARAEDGTWRVTVELLELERVPNTDDMLGSYEAELDSDGRLLGYRYARSQADEGD